MTVLGAHMSEGSAKIEFGENHRRVVSVLMRGTERACDEVVACLGPRSAVLAEVRDDLTSEAKVQLRDLAANSKRRCLLSPAKPHLIRNSRRFGGLSRQPFPQP